MVDKFWGARSALLRLSGPGLYGEPCTILKHGTQNRQQLFWSIVSTKLSRIEISKLSRHFGVLKIIFIDLWTPFADFKLVQSTPPPEVEKMPLYLVHTKISRCLGRRKTPSMPWFWVFIAVLRNRFSVKSFYRLLSATSFRKNFPKKSSTYIPKLSLFIAYLRDNFS